jgi:hypothetical protein
MNLDRTLCTLATCSVEQYGWYSYIPNVGANAAFLVVFAVLAIIQLYLAIRYRVWGAFAGGLVAGCVTEAIGYADVFSKDTAMAFLRRSKSIPHFLIPKATQDL